MRDGGQGMLPRKLNRVAIIPCAGAGVRWGRHLGVPKPLAPVPGSSETLLARNVRLLRAHGFRDVRVATRDPQIGAARLEAEVTDPARCEYLSDTLLSTRSAWRERTLVVLGDVYFSESAFREVVSDPAPLTFFGARNDTPWVAQTGGHAELFAVAFDATFRERFAQAAQMNSTLAVLRDMDDLRRCWRPRRLWRWFRFFTGPQRPPDRGRVLRTFQRHGHRADPPALLLRRGFGPNEFWRALRQIQGDCCDNSWIFGKLWGLLSLLSETTDRTGPRDGPRQPARFHVMSAYAQDVDAPADYERLRRYRARAADD